MAKHMIFVRHPEAEKNVLGAFGWDTSKDGEITSQGKAQQNAATEVVGQLADMGQSIAVYSSSLARVHDLAVAFASAAGVDLNIDARLRSIEKGAVAGWLEADVARSHPKYYDDLTLYRLGLMNSYSIDHPGEPISEFERRVVAAVNEVASTQADIAIVCAHKSTITAALVNFARKSHGYPADFYGYVDVPVGSFSLVSLVRGGGIEFVGLPPGEFAIKGAKSIAARRERDAGDEIG